MKPFERKNKVVPGDSDLVLSSDDEAVDEDVLMIDDSDIRVLVDLDEVKKIIDDMMQEYEVVKYVKNAMEISLSRLEEEFAVIDGVFEIVGRVVQDNYAKVCALRDAMKGNSGDLPDTVLPEILPGEDKASTNLK